MERQRERWDGAGWEGKNCSFIGTPDACCQPDGAGVPQRGDVREETVNVGVGPGYRWHGRYRAVVVMREELWLDVAIISEKGLGGTEDHVSREWGFCCIKQRGRVTNDRCQCLVADVGKAGA